MNWLDMPSLSALRAFAAYAEHGNVVQAGVALNVSHAAISQQLRGLEKHLGVVLLDRSGRSLVLTDAGQRLAMALQVGFGAIGAAIQELSQSDAGRPVHVTCTSSFAASWLMPRLSAFHAAYPGINLTIDPSPGLVPLEPGGVDVALRYGKGGWPGLETELLLGSPMVIVAAPGLLQGKSQITPTELAEYPWLEELGTTEATVWLKSYGVDRADQVRRILLPGNLLLDGLRAGQGVVVTVRQFVQNDLNSGALVELFCEEDSRGYHIVTRPGIQRPELRDFVRWLRRQSAKHG